MMITIRSCLIALGLVVRVPGRAAVQRPLPQLLRRPGDTRRARQRAHAVRDDGRRQRRAVARRVPPAAGRRTIVAVSTFKLTSDMHVLYGAVLGPAARVLYQQASISPSR